MSVKPKKVKPVPLPPPPEPEVEELEPAPSESLFDDETFLPPLPDDIIPLPDDGLPRQDSNLTPDEKQIFIKLLNQYMPLRERAIQLVKLANMSDTKRAPVGLRAIQEINAITRITGDRGPGEAPPMFVLPAEAKVQINVVKVDK